MRRHHAVVVVRRQQHGRRVLALALALAAAAGAAGRLPRPPHVVEGRVPASAMGYSAVTKTPRAMAVEVEFN